jgi:hypothetical protein
MAKTTTPFFPATLNIGQCTLVNADGTTKKTLLTAGAEGAKVVMINVASDDTATADVLLWETIGGTDYLLGMKTIPITAGFVTGTPAFNFFDGIQIPSIPIDRDGQRYLFVPTSGILKVSVKVAVTAAKTLYFFAAGFDF